MDTWKFGLEFNGPVNIIKVISRRWIYIYKKKKKNIHVNILLNCSLVIILSRAATVLPEIFTPNGTVKSKNQVCVFVSGITILD